MWHVDGVRIFKNQKAWVYSFSSMIKKEHEALANKMVFLLINDNKVVKYRTHDKIADAIGYACRTLQSGRFPLVDMEGNMFPPSSKEASLAGTWFSKSQWRAAFCAFKSDLEARVHIHKYTRIYMANQICEHCLAGVEIPYTDFQPNANWTLVRLSHNELMDAMPMDRRSNWQVVPGWNKDRNLEDLLHTLHLGVAGCAIAGFVIDSLQCKHPGLTLDRLENLLQGVYDHYRAWCRKMKTPGSSLRFSLRRFGREKWTSWPELSSQYKASTVKNMIYWVHQYLLDVGDCLGSDNRCNASYSLAMFQNMLDTHGGWFTSEQAAQTSEFGHQFLMFYQACSWKSRHEGRCTFKVVPKFHYFQHLCEYIARTHRNCRP